jgi:hypothetical protein
MTQNTLKVKDYVNLFAHDELELSKGVYEWKIPASYYSNRQSSVCTVSVVGASVQTRLNHGGGIVVSYRYHNGAQNTFDTRRSKNGRDLAVVSYLQSIPSKNSAATPTDPDNSNTHFYTDKEQIKLLVSARPERIVLEFLESGVTNAREIANGFVTLCFEYHDSVDISKQYHEEFTRTL